MPACGAILDLPDPTIDNGIGSADGSTTGDGQVSIDGALPDGFVPPGDGGGKKDGGSTIDDAATCGGKDCHGGECATGNVCQPVAVYSDGTGVFSPTTIVSDGAKLFVISGVDHVYRIDPTVTTPTPDPIATSENNLEDLFVDSTRVYFTNLKDALGNDGKVSSCPSAGTCSTGRIDYVKNSVFAAYGVVAVNGSVYFSNDASGGGAILDCPVGAMCPGSIPTLVAVSNPTLMRTDGTSMFWIDGTATTGGVYQCTLTSCPSGGTQHANTGLTDLAVDATKVYWSDTSSVSWRLKTGGVPVTPLASGLSNVVAIAVDTNGDVYWLEAGNGTNGALGRCKSGLDCSTNPMDAELLAKNLLDAKDFVIAGDSVFYTTIGDNSVSRVTK